MKAFFDKLSKENAKTAEYIRAMDGSVKEVSSSVDKNTESQEVSNQYLKDLVSTNKKRIGKEEKEKAKEKRESERKKADTSFFDHKNKDKDGTNNNKGLLSQLNEGTSLQTKLIAGALGVGGLTTILDAFSTNLREQLNKILGRDDDSDSDSSPETFNRSLGGSIPGDGNGDLVNAKLERGEYVLNKNTVEGIGIDNLDRINFGQMPRFQTGGAVTPDQSTLIPKYQSGGKVDPERKPNEGEISRSSIGDLIFKDGKWMSHTIPIEVPSQQKTKAILEGGGAPPPPISLTKASHPDTGTGWSVGKDGQGRPAVFSKPAAEAFMKIMKESNGIVNPNDITSSTRSPEKNASLPGAAPNSNHLHGNAVDIHGASKAWLKQSGTKYGWKNLNYGGHDGHFDFLNGGALPVQEGPEETSKDKDKDKGGLLGNLMGGGFSLGLGALASIPGIGKLVSSFAKGFATGFGGGDLGGLFSSFLFGGEGNSGDSSGGSGGGGNVSAKVTPGAKGLLDFVAAYESGGDYNKIFGGESIPGLTDKTIAEVVQIQKAHLAKGYESAAIGRYQMMYPDEYAKRAGLSMNDKFSEVNQDKMGMVYLEEDGYSKFKSGGMSAKAFAKNVAGTWAAMPVESGESYHKGVGSNKSLVGYEKFMEQIEASKSNEGVLGFNKGGLVPNPEDTVSAKLTPGEYVVPKETVNKVGAGYLRGLDNEINSMFKDANNTKRGQELSGMVMQPIVINSGGGGGGGAGLVSSDKSESLPTLPNDTGVDFALDLVMTRHTLSSRIGG